MRGLVPRIHDFLDSIKDVDGRDKRGHDGIIHENLLLEQLS
jgi:hypothetical protein